VALFPPELKTQNSTVVIMAGYFSKVSEIPGGNYL
jgi:hypothetical protein